MDSSSSLEPKLAGDYSPLRRTPARAQFYAAFLTAMTSVFVPTMP